MGQFIDLKAADGFVSPAYVAQPTGKPRGGVVVLQEIFGVNTHIREVTDGYAAAGYLAVAPSNFHRVKPGVELGYQPEDESEPFAAEVLANEPPVADEVAELFQGGPFCSAEFTGDPERID